MNIPELLVYSFSNNSIIPYSFYGTKLGIVDANLLNLISIGVFNTTGVISQNIRINRRLHSQQFTRFHNKII